MRHLPVFITEADQGDEPWRNENTGWVKAAYGEINHWNENNSQKIRSLILYRWPKIDQWAIEGKSGVIEDFREALAFGYKWTIQNEQDETDLWQRLQDIEQRLADLQSQIDEAAGLEEALAGDEAKLEERGRDLEAVGMLDDSLQALDSEIAELEHRLADLGAPRPIPSATLPRPDILDIAPDLPQRAKEHWETREQTQIRRIILHHTVTGTDVTPEHLAQVHVSQGKPGIAYHFLVTGGGVIYATQPLTNIVRQIMSSDANAEINAGSIAVALAGDFRASRNVEPNEEQRHAAAHLIAWLISSLGLGSKVDQIVFGRSEMGEAVTSPGDQWLSGVRYKNRLLADIRTALETPAGRADSQELLRLRMHVADLESEIIQLRASADQVEPLQAELDALQTTIQELTARIETLQSQSAPRSAGAARPHIIDIVDALPTHPDLPPYQRRSQPITTIVIHHTDTPKNFTVERIAHYHVFGADSRKDPWPGIGYHYVIGADGSIYQTQRHETHSYHVGAANGYSLGVSLIGRFLRTGYDRKPQPPADQLPTQAQMDSTARLVAWLLQELQIERVQQVVGHKELGATACPGDQWLQGVRWKDALLERIQARGGDKSLTFYLLFWDHGDQWASADWRNARDYIAHFRPTVGFSVDDALQAQHVLIVGGAAGISGGDEALLRAAGVDVHRLAGADEAETKALLDELVANNTPWPGAPPIASAPPPTGEPEPDAWTIPDDFVAPPPVEAQPAPAKVMVESGLFPPPLADDDTPQEAE
jgi:N-acetyl-anhydromuramyl-L-alanine amidase AmpD/TolA-binding protein